MKTAILTKSQEGQMNMNLNGIAVKRILSQQQGLPEVIRFKKEEQNNVPLF